MSDEKKAPLFDARDVVGIVGVGLVTYGAWLIYQPAAFLVSGGLLIMAAILLSRRG
jgi:hypothetical protein